MKEITINQHLEEKLKDHYFKELYELEQQKYNIVKKIIDFRIKEGLTQGQLAKHVGVSQQHISKIENGEFSSVHVIFYEMLLKISGLPKLKA